jgi:hypothetical protein
MQRVRQLTAPTNYASICEIIEDNPAYPFPGFGNTFPRIEREVPNIGFRRLKALELRKELGLQVARLNHHATKLATALESIAKINEFLTNNAYEEAEASIAAHKEAYGLSFLVLKKELLLGLERHNLPGLARMYKRLTEPAASTAWGLLCHFIYDMMDPSFNPSLAIRAWLRVSANRLPSGEWYARLGPVVN